jgi:hypothetical protein
MLNVDGLFFDILYYDDELSESVLDTFITYKLEGSVSDILREIAEKHVQDNHAELLEWLGNHYDYFEQYINNQGVGEAFNLFGMIKQAQFEYLSFHIGSDLMRAYAYHFILNELELQEITKEQNEKIEDLVRALDDLMEFKEEIKKLLKEEK